MLRNAKNPHCVALFCIENREGHAVLQGLTQISLISEYCIKSHKCDGLQHFYIYKGHCYAMLSVSIQLLVYKFLLQICKQLLFRQKLCHLKR